MRISAVKIELEISAKTSTRLSQAKEKENLKDDDEFFRILLDVYDRYREQLAVSEETDFNDDDVTVRVDGEIANSNESGGGTLSLNNVSLVSSPNSAGSDDVSNDETVSFHSVLNGDSMLASLERHSPLVNTFDEDSSSADVYNIDMPDDSSLENLLAVSTALLDIEPGSPENPPEETLNSSPSQDFIESATIVKVGVVRGLVQFKMGKDPPFRVQEDLDDELQNMKKKVPLVYADKLPIEVVNVAEPSPAMLEQYTWSWKKVQCTKCSKKLSVTFIERHYMDCHKVKLKDPTLLYNVTMFNKLQRMGITFDMRTVECPKCDMRFVNSGCQKLHFISMHGQSGINPVTETVSKRGRKHRILGGSYTDSSRPVIRPLLTYHGSLLSSSKVGTKLKTYRKIVYSSSTVACSRRQQKGTKSKFSWKHRRINGGWRDFGTKVPGARKIAKSMYKCDLCKKQFCTIDVYKIHIADDHKRGRRRLTPNAGFVIRW